jgi:hypothetical protein
MIRRLREKPCAGVLSVVEGDFCELRLKRTFPLVYCVGQSFFQVQTQQRQLSCLAAVAEHLGPDGRFVLECLVPDVGRFRVGQDTLTSKVRPDRVLISASTHDPLNQLIRSNLVEISASGTRLYPNYLRYAWPSELLLLADKAGLELRGRWANYAGAAFTGKPGAYVCEFGRR